MENRNPTGDPEIPGGGRISSDIGDPETPGEQDTVAYEETGDPEIPGGGSTVQGDPEIPGGGSTAT
ncbi:MAG: hypothetical protein QOH63_3023 [Acidobacteriota bacterium]|jgi:hypothetical protein|nr:hypothetical protein [Acidobacteriota bacterium]